VELNSENFKSTVDGSTNVLVEFFAPWCGHCKNLAPEWKIAGETFQPSDDVVIAAVDATASPDLAKEYGVSGYPTIKFFAKGSEKAEDYGGGRTADTIVKWVNDKIGTSRRVKVAPSAVTTLTSDNFDELALGSKAALVEFYAPWCGHCKSLAPKYESLANVFAGDKDVLIAKVDATEESDLANRFGVSGYPTLKFFPAGSAVPVDYNEARELDDLVKFINTQAGTTRNSDGSLTAEAGRIASLDAVIAEAGGVFDAGFLDKLTSATKALEGKEAAFGKLYASASAKVVAKGIGYVETEIKRLQGMISSPSVVAETKTNFQLRQNILRAFSA